MKKFFQILIVAAGCLGFGVAMAADQSAAGNGGQTVNTAANLEQLLQQVKKEQSAAAAQNKAREREFLQARNQQQAMLAKAKAEQKNVQARSDQLQKTFDANEKDLNDLTTQLHNRQGDLGEVFGVVRTTAGDLKGITDSSLISAQIQGRGQFLSRMAAAKTLPSTDDLHKLWYMLLQQATAEGQVVKFPATVTRPDGTQAKANVVRVGTFDAILDDQYLNYLPETGQLVVYARQPSGSARALAQNLYNAKSGYHKMAVDPTGGELLSLLLRYQQTFKQRLDEGGAPGYTIVVLFIIGILVALERIVSLTLTSRKVKAQLKSNKPDLKNPLGRVLNVYNENPHDDVQTLELKLDEAILKEAPALEARLGLIKLIAAVGPLLGLLGTVIGMILTFQTITTFGSSDPRLMAKGIAYALVTTVEGLVTAIPLVMLHAYISSKSRSIVQVLEEQSAGIIAAQAEKQK